MSDRERLHDAVREVRAAYNQLNEQRLGRRWDLTDYALGFVGDVGDLAKLVTAHEGHRTDVAASHEALAHELSDCLFSLLVIAEATGIDLEARFPADMAALADRVRARIAAGGPASPADAACEQPPPTPDNPLRQQACRRHPPAMETPPDVIELEELTLRRFEGEADLPELTRVIDQSIEHLRPWMPWVAEHSPQSTRDFLLSRDGRWAQHKAFTYAIVSGGAIAGTCQLFPQRSPTDRTLGIGYWLHPAETGRGLATRAARALVLQAFLLPDVGCVEIVHDPANTASGAVPARLGFTAAERRPAPALAPTETGEEQVWRLTREQHRTLRRSGTPV